MPTQAYTAVRNIALQSASAGQGAVPRSGDHKLVDLRVPARPSASTQRRPTAAPPVTVAAVYSRRPAPFPPPAERSSRRYFGRSILQVVGNAVALPSTLASLLQPRPLSSTSYF